jgi:putative transposase
MAEKANDTTISTKMMCDVAGVSESGYYAWRSRLDRPPTPTQQRRRELSETVCEIFHDRKSRYGYRRIHAELLRDGWVVSDRTVRVIMGEHGLVSCHPRPWRYCTKADGTPPADGLIRRDFNATEPGVRFVGDITQIDTWAGPGYLATVIDLFNRQVVGWAIADHHRTDLICDAIRMARRNKRIKRRAIFHSDRGVEYTSRQFRRCLKEARMRPSMGRVGTCPLTGQSRGTLSACASTSIGRFNRHYPGPPGLPIFDWPDNVTTMLWLSRSLLL